MNSIFVEYVENLIRQMLARPEMYAVNSTALAYEVGAFFEMINKYKFKKDNNDDWQLFIANNSYGPVPLSKVQDIRTMRNLLDRFLREQYHKNNDIWISE